MSFVVVGALKYKEEKTISSERNQGQVLLHRHGTNLYWHYNVSNLLSIFIIRIHTVCTVLHLCMVVNRVLLLSYPNFAKSDIELLNSKI